MTDYRAFLESKIKIAGAEGITVDAAEVNPLLKPHQVAIVIWALKGGRRAIFASFGLGKSFMQLEIMRLSIKHLGGRALIVVPLGARQEFIRDARVLATGDHPRVTDAQRAALATWWAAQPDRPVEPRYINRIEQAGTSGLYLTNYEPIRDGKLDPNAFTAASLDEADVLRSFGSKTYHAFLAAFWRVRMRFVATATPSPNRYKELIHYAGFLGVMDTGQALTRFFQRNSEQAGDLTLYPHKEREFWLWLNSWGAVVQRPSDLGYSDDGYLLPPLVIRWHEVQVDLADAGTERDGQGLMFRGGAVGVSDVAREKRSSLPARIAKMTEILQADPDAHRILWHDLEAEREAIEAAVPTARSVYGAQDIDARERTVIEFSDGRFQYLAAKPVIAGAGCNFQRHCHKALFLGIGHKFRDLLQAIHRIQRFLQERPVEIDLIYAESEREVRRALEEKWARDIEMRDTMSDIIRRYGLKADLM
ncbi:DNA methylase N-4, partial [Azospirillum sp. B4]|uniref:DNA methylase N-4 n=1 Tax=Azospirillum sp. B4 TaxID=95605 RepID=UPI0005C91330